MDTKKAGAKGGSERARRMTPEARKKSAQRAAEARWGNKEKKGDGKSDKKLHN